MSIQVGSQLQAIPDSWNGSPTSYSYQWQKNTVSDPNDSGWVSIVAATHSDFVVTSGESGYYLSALETATNVAGSSTAVRSAVVGPVAGSAISAGKFQCRTFGRH